MFAFKTLAIRPNLWHSYEKYHNNAFYLSNFSKKNGDSFMFSKGSI